MAHPYDSVRHDHRAKAHGVLERSGNKKPHRASGGHVHADEPEDAAMIEDGIHEHESHLHPSKKKTKLRFSKNGGHVEGIGAKHHMGKRARGGRTGKSGGKHVTNVIVAPQGGGGMHPPMPGGGGMQGAAPPPPRPAAPPPPRPAGPPPGAGGMPPGGGMPTGAGGPPPGMMNRGGGTHRARGGRTQKMEEEGVPHESLMQANKGGKVHHRKHRDMGGPTGSSAGVPANPSQMTPQQVQQIAQQRQQQGGGGMPQGQRPMGPPPGGMPQGQRPTGMPQSGQMGGQRPPMQPPMSAAQAAGAGNAPPQQKRGGEVRVKEHSRRAAGGKVEMEAGAGGGQGRIEKTHEYGSGRGFKPKERPLHAR
jgi:hypothetical protein